MRVTPIRTSVVHPSDSLFDFIASQISQLEEKTILVVTSKIVALCENRVVPKRSLLPEEKYALIRSEADQFLEPTDSKYQLMLTVRQNILGINAGIDQSNVENAFVLLPINAYVSARNIWEFCRKQYGVKEVGIIITDSKAIPLKWGITGSALAYCGFKGVVDRIGHPDIFGRKLQMTKVNVVEALAAAAVVEMGETNEQQPLCFINECQAVEFSSTSPTEEEIDANTITLEDDVYAPLLTSVSWKQGKK